MGTRATDNRFEFTRERIEAAPPPQAGQRFYWDRTRPGLGLRVTAAGARAFVFEGKLGRQTVRVTIGPASMPIRSAKDKRGAPLVTSADSEAARLAGLMAQGVDPRREYRDRLAAQEEKNEQERAARLRERVSGLVAWAEYCEAHKPDEAAPREGRDRKKQRGVWNERTHRETVAYASAGGAPRRRGPGKTAPGPLHDLLDRPLARIEADAVLAWVKKNRRTRQTTAQLGFRLLSAFISWCVQHPEYKGIVQADACRHRDMTAALGAPRRKDDCLTKQQLPAWFSAVRGLASPVALAYLQALLLTGARREEVASLRWHDVDFRWNTLTLRDKTEGERTIPLTPYVASLLQALPRRNAWVFSSPRGKDGRLVEPRIPHNRACTVAGIEGLTLHGLRRSFTTLSEWTGAPSGAVAQIQGHAPSGTQEQRYKRRPLDLLAVWSERIEAWMLAEAGIHFDANATAPGGLQVIKGGAAKVA